MLDTATALTDQATIALYTTLIFQFLKKSKWFPWLTLESQNLNRIVGVVLAFAAAIGVSATFDQTAGQLTITGLTLVGLFHGTVRFLQQWAFQQGAYKLIVAPPMPGQLQAGAEKHPPELKLEPQPVVAKE